MSWGIADTAPDIEKIKAESADYLNGLNSCGVIEYSAYSNAFDFYADLLDKAYEQGQKDAERKTGRWIDDGTELGCQCSECGKSLDEYINCGTEYMTLMEMPKFCPNCGADMREKTDGHN